jgi:hypothetical protein
MFKLDIQHTDGDNAYNQVPQNNPMRWQIMFRKKDLLTSQAHQMKCRDFFNDLVAKYAQNVDFTVYRFDNSTIKFNKFGLYFLLTDIHNPDQFIANVERTLQPKLKEQLNATIRLYKQGDKSVVVRLPLVVWTKTYYASVATIALRLCNNTADYQSWEELFAENNPVFSVDHAMKQAGRKYVRENGFKLPEAVQNYWWYCGPKYNSETHSAKELPTVVHNNGLGNWVDYMKNHGVI